MLIEITESERDYIVIALEQYKEYTNKELITYLKQCKETEWFKPKNIDLIDGENYFIVTKYGSIDEYFEGIYDAELEIFTGCGPHQGNIASIEEIEYIGLTNDDALPTRNPNEDPESETRKLTI